MRMREAGMRKSPTEIKTEMMKQAETIIDELIEWQAETGQPDSNQIEAWFIFLRKAGKS